MKRKDFFIGLNGLILVYLSILWLSTGFVIEDFFDQFVRRFYPLIIWSIVNLIYWYRVKE
ncbi:MAG TPA: hypothetical protein VFH18_07835 [Erysipelotrichaceae bacterium]|nr:hypothetical protein [Erysipelotrichaceae bacterium]